MMNSQLRSLVADALYPISAYQLPAACERYGMEPGDDDEAMKSKQRYVMKRLQKLSDGKVLEIAKRVVEDQPDDKLQAAIDQLAGGGLVTDVTRHRLATALNAIEMGGSRGLVEILRKHFPVIDQIDSQNDPFEKLADDVHRYMVCTRVWSNAEILEQLGFLTCSQSKLFRFLEGILHPIIRDPDGQHHIAGLLNPILAADGFALKAAGRVSGSTIFRMEELGIADAHPADDLISEAMLSFDVDGVHAAWNKALKRRREDPEGAITAARSLLETVCKHIIDEAGGSYGQDDLPKLYAIAAEHLNLAPSQHAEPVFKSILGNCQSVVGNLAGIRNKLGDSHGTNKRHVRPKPRHAELAVNLAGSVAMFLINTWQERDV